jgi:hypothetical protein
MNQYKYLVRLFKYTKNGDEEKVLLIRFDPSLPKPDFYPKEVEHGKG